MRGVRCRTPYRIIVLPFPCLRPLCVLVNINLGSLEERWEERRPGIILLTVSWLTGDCLTYCNDISRHEEYSHYTPDPAMYCVVAVVMTGVVDGCQQTTQEMQFNHDENPLAAPLKASHC